MVIRRQQRGVMQDGREHWGRSVASQRGMKKVNFCMMSVDSGVRLFTVINAFYIHILGL
jgi:hypothetical protein